MEPADCISNVCKTAYSAFVHCDFLWSRLLYGICGRPGDGIVFDVTGNEWMRMLWSMVCSTIMFGIVGSVVANVFQLPDILESVRSIGVGMKDLYRIGMAKSGISYQNPDKERNNERKI